VADYRRLLEVEGLPGDTVAIGEHHLQARAFSIPSGSVRDLRKRLVAQIESRRVSANGTWRRVLASACSQTAELIDAAAVHERELSEHEDRVNEVVSVQAVKPLAAYPPGLFDRAVEASVRSPRRARRALHRGFATPEALSLERLRLIESVVLCHEAALNGARESAGRVVDDDDYETLRLGVERWMAIELPMFGELTKRDRAIGELLIRIAAVTPEEWPLRLLDSLSQRLDPLYAAKLASSLADEVEPAVDRARDKALMRVGPGSDEVARARSALGAVIAGYTFSDA
jgi:hypothetical protein